MTEFSWKTNALLRFIEKLQQDIPGEGVKQQLEALAGTYYLSLLHKHQGDFLATSYLNPKQAALANDQLRALYAKVSDNSYYHNILKILLIIKFKWSINCQNFVATSAIIRQQKKLLVAKWYHLISVNLWWCNFVTIILYFLTSSLFQVRPNAIALVDAFNYTDHYLGSILGRYDGNVYPKLYEAAWKEPLNDTVVPDGYHEYVRPLLKQQLHNARL